MKGGTTQTLRPAQRLDQSDVEESEQNSRNEETHRRFDPVENVAGSGDVAEWTEVDEQVLVALAGRQRCCPGSTQGVVGRRRV